MSEITLTLTDGRTKTVDAMSRHESGWVRCITDKPTPRMRFDQTITYYHQEDIEAIDDE